MQPIAVLSWTLLAIGLGCAPGRRVSAPGPAEVPIRSRQMADDRPWTTFNLNLTIADSYCYADAERNCRQYGRLYTWKAAGEACRALGEGWRLPSAEEWRRLARRYGGVSDESPDSGRAAFRELSVGGSSAFDAVLGGGRDGQGGGYARLDAHGFYWTATEDGPTTAGYYNFGKGGQALHFQSEGAKDRAFSVRCIATEHSVRFSQGSRPDLSAAVRDGCGRAFAFARSHNLKPGRNVPSTGTGGFAWTLVKAAVAAHGPPAKKKGRSSVRRLAGTSLPCQARHHQQPNEATQ